MEKQRFEKKDSSREPRQVSATLAAVVGTQAGRKLSLPSAIRFGGEYVIL